LASLAENADVTLVFSDIVMPGGMSGVSLAAEIHRLYRNIPVLLTSGYSDLAESASCSLSILRKPFDIAGLDAAIDAALKCFATARESDAGRTP
jgi:DNA-binding NtrC family response regulator